MKKILVLIMIAVLVLDLSAYGVGADPTNSEAPRIGVAWRSNQKSETFVATCQAIEKAGAVPVVLDLVTSADLTYEDGLLTDDAIGKNGELTEEAVKLI